MIIEILKNIHQKYRINKADVSSHTRSAQKITKEWQALVCTDSIVSEVVVSPENNEKIDLVDLKQKVAYELKVSGKNVNHEFYKDIAKILTYNEYQPEESKITKLIFISESFGIKSLDRRLDSRFLNLIESAHNLVFELVSI
ncbi:MAG: hypothetical protein U9R17_08905 [Thermodesulfobacteriota bacterium]|nr:hypothetical protein [Thermodesulfobacteriota bacterium]